MEEVGLDCFGSLFEEIGGELDLRVKKLGHGSQGTVVVIDGGK